LFFSCSTGKEEVVNNADMRDEPYVTLRTEANINSYAMDAFFVSVMMYQNRQIHNIDERNARNNLFTSLVAFRHFLEGRTERSRGALKMTHDAQIRSTRMVIRSVKERRFEDEERIIYSNLLQYDGLKYRATDIFTEFVKGISYFAHESVPPDVGVVYHRPKACGERSMPKNEYKALHRCSLEPAVRGAKAVRAELKSNGTRVFKCLLERVIYDQIFTRLSLLFPSSGTETSAQNMGHTNMIEDLRKDFKTCFPGVHLFAEVRFDDANIPIGLVVEKRRIVTGSVTERITYFRTKKETPSQYSDMYDISVFCVKESNGQTLYKLQYFTSRNKPWSKNSSSNNFEQAHAFMSYGSVSGYESQSFASY
jgi:hypothetical protein